MKHEITLTEAARALRVDPRTVKHWIQKGRLTARRDHRGWFWLDKRNVRQLVRRFGLTRTGDRAARP